MMSLDDVADELEPLSEAVESEVDAIDEVIFYLSNVNDQADVLRRIANVRKRLGKMIRALKVYINTSALLYSIYINFS